MVEDVHAVDIGPGMPLGQRLGDGFCGSTVTGAGGGVADEDANRGGEVSD